VSPQARRQGRRLLLGDGSVLYPPRYDDEFARSHLNRSIPELHPKSAAHAKEQFVFVVMMMPDERPFEFHELHFLAVQLADDLRVVSPRFSYSSGR
jgi:hypothetical protein